MPNLIVLRALKDTEEPSQLWSTATPLSWKGMRGYTPLPTCVTYHVKFGSPAINGVRINRKEPPKLGSSSS